MRAETLLLDALGEQLQVLELPRLDHLGGEVGPLVGDELAGDVDPVRGEEATREPAVDRPVEVEGVPGDEPADTGLEHVRVPEAPQHAAGETRADLGVRVAPGVTFGLAEVVQQRAEAHGQRRPGVGGVLDDREEVLVERAGLAGRAELVADRPRGTRG